VCLRTLTEAEVTGFVAAGERVEVFDILPRFGKKQSAHKERSQLPLDQAEEDIYTVACLHLDSGRRREHRRRRSKTSNLSQIIDHHQIWEKVCMS
jgi:hypothetical protein